MFLVGLIFLVVLALLGLSTQVFAFPRPFIVHGVLAMCALPLMWAAMLHFVPVLTRSGRAPSGLMALPGLAFMIGLGLLLAFSGEISRSLLLPAAGVLATGALLLAGWSWQRGRQALGKPHPGSRWYLAALLCLILALAAVPGMVLEGERYPFWYGAHLHLNVFGWIGLTVLGTLPVLLPTCLQKFDSDAAFRLKAGLPWGFAAVIAIALAAALKTPVLGGFGAAILIGLLFWHWKGWFALYGPPWRWPGPAVSLWLGSAFLIGLLILGVVHGFVGRGGGKLLPAFLAGFLLPVILGALAQLLPVWRFRGPDSAARQTFARVLAKGAGWRGGLCLLAGIGALLGYFPLLGLAGLAVLWMLLAVAWASWSARTQTVRVPPTL